jgi:hypothetical protein
MGKGRKGMNMTKLDELIYEAEQLPAAEKWRLVKQLLRSLEEEQHTKPASSDWHEFLRETYGSLRDTPIERWDQGEYEEREPFE